MFQDLFVTLKKHFKKKFMEKIPLEIIFSGCFPLQ